MKQGTVAQTYTEHFEDSGRKIMISVSSMTVLSQSGLHDSVKNQTSSKLATYKKKQNIMI